MDGLALLHFSLGFCLGVFFLVILLTFRSAHGVFYTSTNDDGDLKYILALEKEPGELVRKRYLFFKVVEQA